ncbi:hypothetical protein [Croceicoccus sp. BE223]|uniref:hypothetical protein n=1 Tax=Croceicoccus sp. BE223 TaxID=2817716 RepID=UPI002859C5C0|nr:hypothetical protein [Croceicoccus sp. BE223]MDR7102964.1 hypothetical protein [Croceicoccus sp. BE223]
MADEVERLSEMLSRFTEKEREEFFTMGGAPSRVEVAFLSSSILDSISDIISAMSAVDGINNVALQRLKESLSSLKEALIMQRLIMSKVDPIFANKLNEALHKIGSEDGN